MSLVRSEHVTVPFFIMNDAFYLQFIHIAGSNPDR